MSPRLPVLVPLTLLLALALGPAPVARAEPAEPLRKLHVLLVMDTDDEAVGETVLVDKARVLRLLKTDLPGNKLDIKVLEKRDVTGANIVNYYKKLKLGRDEGVLFYYCGHGGATPDGRLFFILHADRDKKLFRGDLRKTMEGTGAGLVVLLTDCCSTIARTKGRSAGDDPVPQGPAVATKREFDTTLVDLLLRSRGTVNITAADLGERAYCDEKNGGVFTRALCSVLARPPKELDTDRDGVVTWKEVYPLINKKTRDLFAQLKAASPGEIEARESQSPKQFALGLEERGAGRGTYGVVSLQNLTGERITFEFRWEGESAWQKGELLHNGRRFFAKPVPAGTKTPPMLEAKFNKIRTPQRMTSQLWTGAGKPGFGNGELYLLNPRRQSGARIPEESPRNPQVTLGVRALEVKEGDTLTLTTSVAPGAAGVKPVRASLWLEEYRYLDLKPDARGTVEREIKIPASALRAGTNRLRLVAETDEGDRREMTQTVEKLGAASSQPALYALCVGANGYRGVRGIELADLRCPEGDAQAVAHFLEAQKGKLYSKVQVQVLTGPQVKAETILAQLSALAGKARPEDRLVLFLAGHAYRPVDRAGKPAPGAWSFVCPDSNLDRPTSLLSSHALAEALAGLPCRKVVLLDTNYSARVAPLLPAGSGMLFLAAAGSEQSSYEPNSDRNGKHSLFVQALLEGAGALKGDREVPPDRPLTFEDLARFAERRVPERLVQLGGPRAGQVPMTLPSPAARLGLFTTVRP